MPATSARGAGALPGVLLRSGVGARHRIECAGRVARLLELFQRFAAHGRVDVQVDTPDHAPSFSSMKKLTPY